MQQWLWAKSNPHETIADADKTYHIHKGIFGQAIWNENRVVPQGISFRVFTVLFTPWFFNSESVLKSVSRGSC